MVIIASASLFLVLINWPTGSWQSLISVQAVGIIGLMIAGLILLRKILSARVEKRCDAEFSESTLSDPNSINCSDDSLIVEQPKRKTLWKWRAFERTTVQDGSIYLWFGKIEALIIPSSTFDSEESLQKTADYFRKQIKQ